MTITTTDNAPPTTVRVTVPVLRGPYPGAQSAGSLYLAVALQDIARGRATLHESSEDFVASLRQRMGDADRADS